MSIYSYYPGYKHQRINKITLSERVRLFFKPGVWTTDDWESGIALYLKFMDGKIFVLKERSKVAKEEEKG